MEKTEDWTLVRTIPGCMTFHRFKDGRLCASTNPNGAPQRVRWVDVNAPALLDVQAGLLKLPVLDAETGRPEYMECPRAQAPVVVMLTGVRAEPMHPGDWLEAEGARYLRALTEGLPGPRWTYRPEDAPGHPMG